MSELGQWGTWWDPKTEQGLQRYAEQGLVMQTPDDARALDDQGLQALGLKCVQLVHTVFEGQHPLSSGDMRADAAKVVQDVRAGVNHLFTLQRRDANASLEAMGSIVMQPQKPGQAVHFAELGRACGLPTPPGEQPISSRALLMARVAHAFTMPGVDMLYSSIRVAAEGYGNVSSGQNIQRIWYDGLPDRNSPLVTAYASPDYALDKPEPFLTFCMPTRPLEWAAAVRQHPIFLDSAADKAIIDTLITEGTQGLVVPKTVIAARNDWPIAFGLTQLHPASDRVAPAYLITDTQPATHELPAVNDELESTFSQKVILGGDITQKPKCAQICRALATAGFKLAGWFPDKNEYGAISLVYTRINPERPGMPPKYQESYFRRANLLGTHAVLTEISNRVYAAPQEAKV